MRPNISTILYPSDLGPHMRPVFRFALDLARKYLVNNYSAKYNRYPKIDK